MVRLRVPLAALASPLIRFLAVLRRYLTNSDYLAGMLAMSVLGIARDGVATMCTFLLSWAVRRLWTTVRLEEKDADLVLAWLRERPEVHSSSHLSLFTRRSPQSHARVFEYEPEIEVTTRLRVPNKDGSGQWIWIKRQERADTKNEPGRNLQGAEISFLGRDKRTLESLLEAGREIARRRREKYLTVVQVYDYGKDHGLNWLHPQDKDKKQPGRSISSVVLPRCSLSGLDQAEALLEDAREFLASELWYTERGIPYRRGYLLHGVPGGGKSSLVMAVASELRLPIYMLQLSSELMSDDTLNTLLQYGMHDPPTILLLEDVDLLHSAVLHRRSSAEERKSEEELKLDLLRSKDHTERKGRGRLSLSGLLNALDGPTATSGRLLFMTTNARDRLDPALLRSGRIDYEVEFSHAEPEQIRRLFARFYADFRNAGHNSGMESGATTGGADSPGGASVEASGDIETGMAVETGLTSETSVQAAHSVTMNTSDLAESFAEEIVASGLKLTTADIQRHLMLHKTNPERSLRDLPKLLRRMQEQRKGDLGSSGHVEKATLQTELAAASAALSVESTPATSGEAAADLSSARAASADSKGQRGSEDDSRSPTRPSESQP
mmetsp:Transcript_40552/g.88652  ORF Transcript_40552/g.88652 Transcript_40552/m.88652 type:complete len:610 (+) Transcript_40552:52-1881(+)